MTIDFGKSAGDYTEYRPGFHSNLLARLQRLGVAVPDQTILDAGAGTGLLGAALAPGGAHIVESDPSLPLLRQSNCPARVAARVEHLPFQDASFDAVTAGQCWHWFDRHAAPREIARVLKPRGRVAVVYQTYLPIAGNVAHASEELILRYRPNWRHAGGVGINGQALKDLQSARFTDIESFSFDAAIPFTRDQWRGFIRTCSAVGPSLSAADLSRFDAEHAQILQTWPETLDVPHRLFAAVATRP